MRATDGERPNARRADAALGARFVVVGSSGAGKTAFARRLAASIGVPHVELDALHFAEDWAEVPDEVFAERARDATASDGWVLDGNYAGVMQGLTWPRAQAIVWLDYPFRTCAWRLLRRTVARSWRGEELWQGNRESWRMSFASRDSILLWLLRTFRRRRRDYEAAMSDPAHAHLEFVRLRSPGDAERWLESVIPTRRSAGV
ncbi:MAG: adenylate kinase [Chloroflexi bacterium]|nr:adenylate kinase [Chloroflexota bacterium]